MAEATHSYLDWQISTLMLAHDVVEPLPREDVARQAARQQSVEREVHDLAMAVIPQSYRENPQADFPPEIVMLLTKATIRRAAEISGLFNPGKQ